MPLIKLTVNRRVTFLYKVRSLKSFSKRWTEVCHSPGKHVQMFLHKITKLFNISSSTIWSSEILKESLCARDKTKTILYYLGSQTDLEKFPASDQKHLQKSLPSKTIHPLVIQNLLLGSYEYMLQSIWCLLHWRSCIFQ